jgi:hypothetical protein
MRSAASVPAYTQGVEDLRYSRRLYFERSRERVSSVMEGRGIQFLGYAGQYLLDFRKSS